MTEKIGFRGGRFSGNPEESYLELEKIRKKNNSQLTAHMVVVSAKKKTSVLHHHFEWDDAKAAHGYRLGTARGLIKALIRVRENKQESPCYANIILVPNISEESSSQRYYQNVEVANIQEIDSAIAVLSKKILELTISVQKLQFISPTAKHRKTAKKMYDRTCQYQQDIEAIVQKQI